jgi:predicted membrane protein
MSDEMPPEGESETPPAETSEPEAEPKGTAILETGPPIPSPAPPPTRTSKLPLTRLMLGALFVAGGALWLLGALDVVDVSVTAALSVALIVVGLALVAGSFTGRHTGLITIGIVLTVGLALASTFDIRLEGGIGERNERPASVAELKSEYKLGVGQLTIDLTGITFAPGTTHIKARVGIGQLTVHIPADVRVFAEATAGLGEVLLFGRQSSGFDVELSTPVQNGIGRGGVLTLELSVGLGQVTVDGQ